MNGSPQGEIHADMLNSAAAGCATRMNLGRAAHQGDQDPPDGGPSGVQSLTAGDKSDCPTDENRCAEIQQPTDLKIKDREPIYSDERRIIPRQKDLPPRPQNQTGSKVSRRKKKERGEDEHRPRRSGAPRLKLALLCFESWSWEDVLMK